MPRSSTSIRSQPTEAIDSVRHSSTLDPDESSYFLVRRKSKKGSDDSQSTTVSPGFGESRAGILKSANSPKSGESNTNNREGDSLLVESSESVASRKYRNVKDWNDRGWSDSTLNSRKAYSRRPLDPPRPARDGLEWVWFPEG